MKLSRACFAVPLLALVLAASAAHALPAPAACLLTGLADLRALPDGSFSTGGAAADEATWMQLTRDARARIAATFGEPTARPVLVYFDGADGFGPFRLNAFGSTNFVGPRACVFIGPKGQSVDVVAHELMHAELHARVGTWQRWTQVPAWFDEGVAMQVDWRPRYALPAAAYAARTEVMQLTTADEFFSPDDQVLTRNYARARAVVSEWLEGVGNGSLFDRLDALQNGGTFDRLWRAAPQQAAEHKARLTATAGRPKLPESFSRSTR